MLSIIFEEDSIIKGMYIPEEFKIIDLSVIKAFIAKYNFGMLLMNGIDGIPTVSHVPFVFREVETSKFELEFHLAKANPQAQVIKNGGLAKVVVNGPNAYISSAVYGHVNVPTYNYQTVHLIGSLEVLTASELQKHTEELVTLFESPRNLQIDIRKWPVEMLEAYSKEIVGVRLSVFKMEAAFKLSQNRNETDYQAIIDDLSKGNWNERAVAEEMKKMKK